MKPFESFSDAREGIYSEKRGFNLKYLMLHANNFQI
jgi:hypothetical protein